MASVCFSSDSGSCLGGQESNLTPFTASAAGKERDGGDSAFCSIMRESGWSELCNTRECWIPKCSWGQERRVPAECTAKLHHAYSQPCSPEPVCSEPQYRLWRSGKLVRESTSQSPLGTAQNPPLRGDHQLDDGLNAERERKGKLLSGPLALCTGRYEKLQRPFPPAHSSCCTGQCIAISTDADVTPQGGLWPIWDAAVTSHPPAE